MTIRHTITLLALIAFGVSVNGQQRPGALPEVVARQLKGMGFADEDLADLLVKDDYRTTRNGLHHFILRQRWQGIDVWNGDIAIHTAEDGSLVKLNNGAAPHLAKRVNATGPVLSAGDALRSVLAKTAPGVSMPMLLANEDGGRRLTYEGSTLGEEPVRIQLVYQPVGDRLRLAWNVNHYTPDGSHWWNVRIDAVTGAELDRNDWVAQCGFDHVHGHTEACPRPEVAAAPLAPNDYRVYPWPMESPSHGAHSIRNAPWLDGGIASPFGWHDDNGVAGAEYTDTRGNNVLAQEDADANNTGGYRPSGGANLDFDFAVDFAQAPVAYRDAVITNLYYWNNLMHDVWYQYGFDEPGGNFQTNSYGRGGAGGDAVRADALDGSGTNNANFGTPPDGGAPRMQMFVWTGPNPDRTSDLDNGIIAHEFGHGISNRLVGGPANVNCLTNAEQMGEGWSDFFGLVMTIEAGDQGSNARGIGTYVLGQPVTGGGIRPAPYSTSFGVNNYTYAALNNASLAAPHGVGFVWCTMLWEMTWELIGQYGFDPDIFNGTGGNNIAMQLVIDGLKLTPCNPGFVDARDAILAADLANGGANQNLIWAAFARRGLGSSASQGSSSNRLDQTEAYDTPLPNNIGVAVVLSPAGALFDCGGAPLTVSATLRNYGQSAQTGFPVRYQLDGGTQISETFSGSLAGGASATFTFVQPLVITGAGTHSLVVSTALAGDQYVANDQATGAITLSTASTISAPFLEAIESGPTTPAGWTSQNPDVGGAWTTTAMSGQGACVGARSWSIDYYSVNAVGQEDRLLTPLVDLASSAGSRLKFNHAYSGYSSSYVDGLRVDVSANCGGTWTTLYQASGAALQTTTYTTNSFIPNACALWQAHDIDISAYDGQTVLFRFVGINGYGNWLYLDNAQVESNGVKVALKLLLDGAYDPGTDRMRDSLRTAVAFPLTEPYTGLGFAQVGGGGETIAASVLTTTGDNAVVDWVLLELRNSATPTARVATRCVLVQRDGDVVDRDGFSPVTFLTGPGTYHIAARHRNHLGAMTAIPVALTGSALTVDFTSAATSTYGTEARRPVNGRMALWPGNVLRDGVLRYTGQDNDRDEILQSVGGSVPTNIVGPGYFQQDVNLDRVVRYIGQNNDRDPILLGIGGSAPTNTRTEQLP